MSKKIIIIFCMGGHSYYHKKAAVQYILNKTKSKAVLSTRIQLHFCTKWCVQLTILASS